MSDGCQWDPDLGKDITGKVCLEETPGRKIFPVIKRERKISSRASISSNLKQEDVLSAAGAATVTVRQET